MRRAWYWRRRWLRRRRDLWALERRNLFLKRDDLAGKIRARGAQQRARARCIGLRGAGFGLGNTQALAHRIDFGPHLTRFGFARRREAFSNGGTITDGC